DYCNTYSNGYGYKVGGLSRYGVDRFRDLTKDWIIRYERDEVLPDLPKIFRKNYFVELGKEVEQAYKKAYIDFKEAYLEGTGDFGDQGNILAKLNRMRHLTGIAKVLPVTDFVEEFLEDNDRKLVLFVHHKDVGLGLANNIGNVCKKLGLNLPLSLTSENAGSDVGQRIDEEFKNDPAKRILVASTLSAGEGKNWQMCSDAIIVERQWNPANEEQAEGRFPRPGATAESIGITYAIALGTPDEYLSEIVEQKREICKKTMGNETVAWDQTSLIKEMSEQLFTRGGKRWNL
ncbi:MAG: helicase-related protein, partial [Thermodesulfobacteriota bacterium]